METLKTIVAFCLSPLILSLLLQWVGWTLFWRRRKTGIALVLSGTIVLVLGSLSGWTYELRREAEHRFPPLELSQIPDGSLAIAVLGTGFNPDSELPANSKVSGAFLARLLEGVRLWRARPTADLFVSVAGPASYEEKQEFLQEIVSLMRLESANIVLLTTAESTQDEATLIAKQTFDKTVLLATSAAHMPRAVQIFESEGIAVLAAPTDYGFPRKGGPRDRIWPLWVPSTDGLNGNHAWLYETVSRIWQSLVS